MTALAITLEENAGRGRYVIALPDGEEGEMTFRRDGAVITIDHTYVPPHHEGQGVAFQLLERAIADARAGRYRIRPHCSYVVVQFARHASEWQDVIAS